ncbi:MAG: hypothetical protein GXP32_08120, partial [Kiritimatiellaeota bacterium]|nr:hypothetical protein [Kiritimatiellota bacterium]
MREKTIILSVFLSFFVIGCNTGGKKATSGNNSLDIVNKIAQAKQATAAKKKKTSPDRLFQDL